jgi:hypothetical protein
VNRFTNAESLKNRKELRRETFVELKIIDLDFDYDKVNGISDTRSDKESARVLLFFAWNNSMEI